MADILIEYPSIPMSSSAAATFSTSLQDAATDDAGAGFRAREAATITHVGFRQGVLTGTPGTIRVGMQTVSATTGVPTGTWLASGSGYADYNSWSGTNDGKFVWIALGSSVTVARGDVFAVFCDPQAVGTWDGSNNVTITTSMGSVTPTWRSPYVIVNSTKPAANAPPFAMRSSTKTYGMPWETSTTVNNNNGSTPDEWGHYFRVPTGVCSTYNVVGVLMPFGSVGDFDLVLYDTDGTTVLQSVSIDKDQGAFGTVHLHYLYFDETTLSALNAGSYYRCVIKPTSATNVSTYAIDVPAAGDLSAWMASESDCYWTERTDAGSWSETTTRILQMRLLISDVTAPSSGGGLIVHPGMSGGMRG